MITRQTKFNNENEKGSSLFDQSIELAKKDISKNYWFNLNTKRIRRLVSFNMDYLRYQKGHDANLADEYEDEGSLYAKYHH